MGESRMCSDHALTRVYIVATVVEGDLLGSCCKQYLNI